MGFVHIKQANRAKDSILMFFLLWAAQYLKNLQGTVLAIWAARFLKSFRGTALAIFKCGKHIFIKILRGHCLRFVIWAAHYPKSLMGGVSSISEKF